VVALTFGLGLCMVGGEVRMKTIGLLGGMTAESSVEYYRIINRTTREKLGGIHSAKSVMVSVDFAEIDPLMEKGRWVDILNILIAAGKAVEKGGADFLVICTNTMHKLVPDIQKEIGIPILSIIDVTAGEIKKRNLHVVGLLGTRFTMVEEFYRKRLEKVHGLRVLIPPDNEVETVHRIIVEELSVGEINPVSKKTYRDIICRLVSRGAEGVILGCTEIPLLVKEQEGNIPLFDTTAIHARAAVNYALEG
jgi:aspartate racemase